MAWFLCYAILGGIFIKKLYILLLAAFLTACNKDNNNKADVPAISREQKLKDSFTDTDKESFNKYLGDVKDNVYTNQVVGFSITLNPDTKYMTQDEKIDVVVNDYYLDQDYYKDLLDEKPVQTAIPAQTTSPEQTNVQPTLEINYKKAENKYGQPFDIAEVKYVPLLTFNLTNDEDPTKVAINAEAITKAREEDRTLKPEHFYKIVKFGLETTQKGLPVESELEVAELAETTLGNITFNRIDSKLIFKEPNMVLNQVLYFKILEEYILTIQATYKDGELENIEEILNTLKFLE